jgi:hypothetical protein
METIHIFSCAHLLAGSFFLGETISTDVLVIGRSPMVKFKRPNLFYGIDTKEIKLKSQSQIFNC